MPDGRRPLLDETGATVGTIDDPAPLGLLGLLDAAALAAAGRIAWGRR